LSCVSILLFGFLLRWALWAHYLNPLNAIDDRQFFVAVYLEKIYYPTYTRLDGLLIGVLLAAMQLFRPVRWNRATKRGNALLIAGLVVLGGAYPICEHVAFKATALLGYPLLAIGFGLLVGASVSSNGILARCRVGGIDWGNTGVQHVLDP
jgi:peptidoglycan/LPS O-acetylase OafA/YrhL